MRLLLVSVLVCGCGRVGFDERDAGVTTDIGTDAARGCVMQVASGWRHICLLLDDGSTRCAGNNIYGELGVGTAGGMQPTPVVATVLPPIVAVATGRSTTCGLRADGSAECIGDNDNRQLDGTATVNSSAMPLVPATPPLSAMSYGAGYVCALTTTNMVICWGDSDEGQGGLGTNPNFHMPETITSLGAVSSIGTGTDHLCAVQGGSAYCWGDARVGRLGNTAPDTCVGASAGTITCAMSPQLVPGVSGVIGIAPGHTFTCAWTSTGSVICWGGNANSECALPVSSQEPPTTIASLGNVQQVVAGREHACARKTDGSVWCWGQGTAGQLGSGLTMQTTPIQVPLPTAAKSLAAHTEAHHTCALLADDNVWCWGANDVGQLGRGSVDLAAPPGAVIVSCP